MKRVDAVGGGVRLQDGSGLTPRHGSGASAGSFSTPPRQPSAAAQKSAARAARLRPLLYILLNVVSASGIVFANKLVFTSFGFHFTCALTLIHTLFTLAGMHVCLALGVFEAKRLPANRLLPLSSAYVAYIVLCNLSLKVNTVGFYQVMKIAVAPTVMALELLMFRRVPPPRVVAAVGVVCAGVGLATVTDSKMISNLGGLAVGLAATLVTGLYQIWAGSKQRELKASTMQLLHQYTPQAAALLAVLIPLMEPVGWAQPDNPETLRGYRYTPGAVAAIALSAVLGVAVTLSTFLVIGATSSLTYNVVGHLKTVIILTGGVLIFGDEMPMKKFFGICVAMAGIVWYTNLKMASAGGAGSGPANGRPPPEADSLTGKPLLPINNAATHGRRD